MVEGNGQVGTGSMDRGLLEDTFGFLLRAAWRDAARTFTRHFRAFDINPQQFATLILVHLNPGCATGDLTEPLGITPNNMVRLLDILAARGLLEKSTSLHDKRVRVLHMTPAGRDFLTQLYTAHRDYDAEFEKKLGADNIQRLCEILRLFD